MAIYASRVRKQINPVQSVGQIIFIRIYVKHLVTKME